jgi:hypothetical protein
MPVMMPVQYVYESMVVHLLLISTGILILHSRKLIFVTWFELAFLWIALIAFVLTCFLCLSHLLLLVFILFIDVLMEMFPLTLLVVICHLKQLEICFYSSRWTNCVTGMSQHTCNSWYLSWLRIHCVLSKNVTWTRTEFHRLLE